MRGKRGQDIFLLTSTPGFLDFFSIRIRGLIYLLAAVGKHFTPVATSTEWLDHKMGKGSSKKLSQTKNKMMCCNTGVVSQFPQRKK